MRRLLPALTILGATALLPPSASAQEPAVIRLTLLAQTPWNSTFDAEHAREVEIRFRAENLGTVPVDDLSIGVSLFGRATTRTAYESALATDPPLVIDAETFPREGALEPGVPRDFELAFPLDSGLDPDDSGVYPLKIDLRSGFTSLAAIRSTVVFLVRRPEVPLDLSWTYVLHHPIAFGPDGVFTSAALEEAIAPGGGLAAEIQALLGLAADPARPPVDVAVTPTLLTQLERMSHGYEVATPDGSRSVPEGAGGAQLADQAIADLRLIAQSPNVQVSALPFSSPELPSLVSGGLERDVVPQMDRGRQVVADALGATPVAAVLRAPGAALDEPTLRELPALGISTLIAGPSTVAPTPQPLGFAGPPTAGLGEGGEIAAIVPEPGLMALLQSPTSALDPVLGAQILLGELATIWQEQPGELRGVALVLSEDLLLAPPFYGAFARGIAGAPWLAPMHAGEFTTQFPPDGPAELTSPTPRRFSSTYVEELRRARRRIDTLRSMLVDPSGLPDDYETMLLLAESRQFLSDPVAGLSFITSVGDSAGAIFDAISVDSVDEITLTSSTGSGIPVTVSNDAEQTLRVTVQLVSTSLRGTPSMDLELGPGDSQTVTFRVEAQRTGRFTVALQLLAPGGRPLGRPQQLIVRSTVYNRIALLITIAAAVVLLGLWARRFVPRRTS